MGPTIQKKVFLAATFSLIAFFSYTRPALCREGEDETKAEVKAKAKAYFERAVVLFNAGDYKGALENFFVSYEARPHGKLKFNIGICLHGLGRYAEAGNAFEEFMAKEGTDSPKAMVEKVMELMDEIRGKAGIVQVKVNEEEVEVRIDGKSFGRSPLAARIYVEPGIHEVEAEAQDGRKWSGKVQVGAGEIKVVKVTLEAGKAVMEKPAVETKEEAGMEESAKEAGPAATGGRKRVGKALFYASLALAAAGAFGGAISGGVAMNKAGELGDLDDDCEAKGCDGSGILHDAYLEEREDIYGAAERAGNASTALFASAGVFAAASIVSLLVWRPWKLEKAPRAGLYLLPAGGGGLVLSVEF